MAVPPPKPLGQHIRDEAIGLTGAGLLLGGAFGLLGFGVNILGGSLQDVHNLYIGNPYTGLGIPEFVPHLDEALAYIGGYSISFGAGGIIFGAAYGVYKSIFRI